MRLAVAKYKASQSVPPWETELMSGVVQREQSLLTRGRQTLPLTSCKGSRQSGSPTIVELWLELISNICRTLVRQGGMIRRYEN